MKGHKVYYSPIIQKAISFAIKIHEIDTKKKRKGKDIPYIIHPLTVGVILARITKDDDVIAAGILHDTIEDCSPKANMTVELLAQEFNRNVADLVWAVTEKDTSLPWHERKRAAIADIKSMTQDQILLKSADVLHNLTELLEDIEKDGVGVFGRFNAGKEDIVHRYMLLSDELRKYWFENPLINEINCSMQRLMTIFLGINC